MAPNKNLNSFVTDLANKYTAMFDVYRDEMLDGFPLSFIAQYKRRDERYMISKKIKVYGVENQQIVFTTLLDDEQPSSQFLQRYKQVMNDHVLEYVPGNQEHMSTIFLGLIVTDQKVDDDLLKEVRRFRKLKFIRFGLHGWIEMYFALINPLEQTIDIHPKGKPFISSIEKMIKEEVTL